MRHLLPLLCGLPRLSLVSPCIYSVACALLSQNTAAVETAQEKPASRNARPDEEHQQPTTMNAQEEFDAEYHQYITGTDSRNGAAPGTPLAPFQVRPVQSKLMPCYNGPNPVKTYEERLVIWKWVKDNGIDHGLPFNKIGDAINTYFFAGQARPEWITDILSGRKTPFRKLAIDAWRKQYYRRQIINQAKELAGERIEEDPQLAAMADQLAAMDRLLMKDKIKKAILVVAILITIISAVAGISFHYRH
jgi:hypothetical protein